MITASECRQQAALYSNKAKAEPHVGLRKALLDLNDGWLTIADQIERLETVRAINNLLH
jgi:hypothetical protein